MPIPSASGRTDLDTIRRSAAVQLFNLRGHQVRNTFVLTGENAGAVAEICRLLDGVPLALELAAAVARIAAWFWLCVYLVMPIGLTLTVVRQKNGARIDSPHRRPLPGWLTIALAVQGVVLLATGRLAGWWLSAGRGGRTRGRKHR